MVATAWHSGHRSGSAVRWRADDGRIAPAELSPLRGQRRPRREVLCELRPGARAGRPRRHRDPHPADRHGAAAAHREDARREAHRRAQAGHRAVRRRRRLHDARRADGPRGLDGDHQRGVRPDVARRLPLRGHDRPAPGRRDARVLRRPGRPRGRPRAGDLRRAGDARIDRRVRARQLKASRGIDFRIRAGINTRPGHGRQRRLATCATSTRRSATR